MLIRKARQGFQFSRQREPGRRNFRPEPQHSASSIHARGCASRLLVVVPFKRGVEMNLVSARAIGLRSSSYNRVPSFFTRVVSNAL